MPSLSGGIGDDFRCKFWPSTHNTFQVATETISESLMQQHWQQAMPQDATEAEKDPWHDLFRNRNPWKCHGIWAIDGNWMQFINLGDTRLGQRVQDMSAVHPCLRTMTMTTNGGNLFQTSTMNIHTSIANHIYIYIDNQNKVSATLVTCWHPSHGFCCGPVAIAGDHAPRGTIWPKVALLSAMREIAGNPPQRQATIVVTLHSEYHLGMAYTTHLW